MLFGKLHVKSCGQRAINSWQHLKVVVCRVNKNSKDVLHATSDWCDVELFTWPLEDGSTNMITDRWQHDFISRRGSLVMATSPKINFPPHDFVVADYRKLKLPVWSSHQWHNIRTKFHEDPCSHSWVTICVRTMTPSLASASLWVMTSSSSQRFMGNGVSAENHPSTSSFRASVALEWLAVGN
jgi:hypothetical protein